MFEKLAPAAFATVSLLALTAGTAHADNHRVAVWLDMSSDGLGAELAARPVPYLELAVATHEVDNKSSDDWLFPTETVLVQGRSVSATARVRMPFARHFAFAIGAGIGHESVTETDTHYPPPFDFSGTSSETTTVSSAEGDFIRADVAITFEASVFTVRVGAGMDGIDHRPVGDAAIGFAFF